MIAAIVDELAPNLVARNSIGHTGAAQLLLTAGDNPERLRSEASFASLCGVSPVPASSGRTVRHRLNRGGDRAANSALHIIAEDQGLRRSPTRRRAFQTRRHSSPEALPCQRGLHAHHAAPQGNQRHANRRLTNRRASAVRNPRRSLSALAARRPAFVHRQARSATPTTKRCARVSAPPLIARSWIGVAADLAARRGWPSFSSSKASTIPRAATRPWAIFRPSNTNGNTMT